MIYIGTAGWTIPKASAGHFPGAEVESEGKERASTGSRTHLQRYAGRFRAVEINSSFYRPHRPATYGRWASSVPPDFRFAVKIPREITHTRRLVNGMERLESFLAETAALGEKLGPFLVQLPPSLRFDASEAQAFFAALRQRYLGEVVCEPRHASWFTAEADKLLVDHRVSRAAADPAPHPLAGAPGGWPGLVYYRLHGSPIMYYSSYTDEQLDALAQRLMEAARHVVVAWCIFDNTAEGAAATNGLALLKRLASSTAGVG